MISISLLSLVLYLGLVEVIFGKLLNFLFLFSPFLGSFFLPPTTALGAGLYSVALYGGLVLFSAFLLYDTQAIIKHAETYPAYGVQGRQFDPISS